MTKVCDCFIYFNEEDLLRTRLEELWDAVDYFILIEGDHTHSGHPKPFYFHENREAFRKYAAKLIVRSIPLPPAGMEPWFGWGREMYQRDYIVTALSQLQPALEEDDIIISSDVDEIPRVRAIEEYKDRQDICCIEETTYHYNLNCQLEIPTIDPKIFRYRTLKEVAPSAMRYHQQAYPVHVIGDGGWHLSFMGGTEKIIEKMKSYAHFDIRDPKMEIYTSRENVEASVKERKSVFLRDDVKYRQVSVDYGNVPRHIAENLEEFQQKGWIVNP